MDHTIFAGVIRRKDAAFLVQRLVETLASDADSIDVRIEASLFDKGETNVHSVNVVVDDDWAATIRKN